MPILQGSELIDYDDCDLYDEFRVPIGIEALSSHILEQMRAAGAPISLLSLCCGTATNEAQLLAAQHTRGNVALSSLHCIDFSTTMLDAARRRLAAHAGHLTLSFDALDVLEADWPGTADAILCCQAIHHFSRGDTRFANTLRFFQKAARYLEPGSRLMLTFSTPAQMLESQWYTAIRAPAGEDDPTLLYGREFPPLELVVGHLKHAGFAVRGLEPLEGPYAPEHRYTDYTLLGDRPFQDSDSFFSIARDRGLLQPYLERVSAMAADGSLRDHIARAEERRKAIGIAYLLVAERV